MRVESLMTKDVKTCRPQDSLSRAAQIFWENDCGFVPVVDTNGLVTGAITDRDVCIAAYMQGKALWEIPVSSVMSRVVFVCRPQDSVSVAQRLMREKQVRRLPVVEGHSGQLVGILSLNDIACASASARLGSEDSVTNQEVADTLSAVCRRRGAEQAAVLLQPEKKRRAPRKTRASSSEVRPTSRA